MKTAENLPKLDILLVEDDKDYRELAHQLLFDHRPFLASTGEEAWESFLKYRPDIVFLDIYLPDMSGHELLVRMQKERPVFVVMLTGSAQKDDVNKAVTQGAAGYILKPLSRQKVKQYLTMYYRKQKREGV